MIDISVINSKHCSFYNFYPFGCSSCPYSDQQRMFLSLLQSTTSKNPINEFEETIERKDSICPYSNPQRMFLSLLQSTTSKKHINEFEETIKNGGVDWNNWDW